MMRLPTDEVNDMARLMGMIALGNDAVNAGMINKREPRKRRLSPFMDWWTGWPKPFKVQRGSIKTIKKQTVELRPCIMDAKAVRQWYKNYKDTLSCVVCGVSNTVERLHFHHVKPRDKSYAIHAMVTGLFTVSGIEREIKKCVPVCKTCHGIIHGHPIFPNAS